MAKNISNPETNELNRYAELENDPLANKWLLKRMRILLENVNLDIHTADIMMDMLKKWKGEYRDRQYERLTAEITRLTELRDSL